MRGCLRLRRRLSRGRRSCEVVEVDRMENRMGGFASAVRVGIFELNVGECC